MTVCTIDGCDRRTHARGWCSPHYNRWHRRRDVAAGPLAHDPDGDNRAIAYYTGAADARNGRARRVDLADTSTIGQAYTRGYDSLAATP